MTAESQKLARAVRRLFVAVLLPPEWIAALATLQDELRGARVPLRFVRPESVHLTLHFLGSTPEDRLPSLDAALRRAAAASRPVSLQLGGVGAFGARRRPRVIWVGVTDGDGALQELQGAIGRALISAGFPVEQRPFQPHLTLARVPDRTSPADAGRLSVALPALHPSAVPNLDAPRFVLMESHLGPGGARYDRIATYALAGASDQTSRS